MALSRIIHKASPSYVLLRISAMGYSSTTLNPTIYASRSPLNQSNSFSTVATDKDPVDTNLCRILEQEIRSAKSEIDNFTVLPKAYSFPFKTKVNEYCKTLYLTREYPDDEKISITIKMSDVNTEGIDSNYKIHCDDDSTQGNDSVTDESNKKKSNKNDYEISEQDIKAPAILIPMAIEVEKPGGFKSLEFDITMSADGIIINKILISNKENDYGVRSHTGPELEGSLSKLQQYIYKYLEIRDIDNNMASFLLKLIAKEKKEIHLKNLIHVKEAIEK